MNIELPSNNNNVKSNINKYSKYYIANYKTIEDYIKIFDKIIYNYGKKIKHLFKDIKLYAIWPKIRKNIIEKSIQCVLMNYY